MEIIEAFATKNKCCCAGKLMHIYTDEDEWA